MPDYYNVVKKPIDIQTIRKRCNDKYYKNRASFLDDMQLLVDNSALYNGPQHAITASAQRLLAMCAQRLNEKRDKLVGLEKAINPLLDDNSLIAFNYLLMQVYEQHVITVDNSFSFLKPVNKAKYKDYYDVIKKPIDLDTIRQRIAAKKYKSRADFAADFDLLYANCLKYNGANNSYTNTAEKLREAARRSLSSASSELGQQLAALEREIADAIQSTMPSSATPSNSSSSSAVRQQQSKHMAAASGDMPVDLSGSFIDHHQQHQQQQQQPPPSKRPKHNIVRHSTGKFDERGPSTSSGLSFSNSSSKKTAVTSLKTSSNTGGGASSSSATHSPKSSRGAGSDADVYVDVESLDDHHHHPHPTHHHQMQQQHSQHHFQAAQQNVQRHPRGSSAGKSASSSSNSGRKSSNYASAAAVVNVDVVNDEDDIDNDDDDDDEVADVEGDNVAFDDDDELYNDDD